MAVKKSATANATEAPTSGATEANLARKLAPVGLTQEQLDFVNLMEQFYAVHDKVMTVQEAIDTYQFDHDEYVLLLQSELVRAALQERGITVRDSLWRWLKLVDSNATLSNFERVGPDANGHDDITDETINATDNIPWKEKALTPLQLIAINTMLDLIDQRSEKKKLQDLGVSTSQWQMWLKDATFKEYLHKRAESLLGDHSHEAHLALVDKIRMGDIAAIKYYNEMTGRYVQQTAVSTGSVQQTDFKQLLIRILEIINDEVDDQETAFRIAERFKALISIQHMANQMTDDSGIVQPEVAPARALSPRLMELMEKGAGS